MSQDYFLNKIYDSLLTNKTFNKTKYRSLTEAYSSLFEQEPSAAATNTANVSAVQPEQPEQTQSSFNFEAHSQNTWNDTQKSLYSYTAHGTGPGEFSIANVLTNETDPDILKKCISGQGLSYDVTWPMDVPENQKKKFEVKQIEVSKKGEKSVRTGKHGQSVGARIVEEFNGLINVIFEELSVIDSAELKSVNDYFRAKLGAVKQPEPGTTKAGVQRKQPTAGERQKYEVAVKRQNDWDIRSFLNAIRPASGEFPFTYIFDEFFNKRIVKGAAYRGVYPLMSLETFLRFINEYQSAGTNDTAPDEKIGTLQKTFKQYYSSTDPVKKAELDKKIDDEAVRVDKKLSREKIKLTGEGQKNADSFFNSLKTENLSNIFETIKAYINNTNTMESIFPNDGLFVVDVNGWKYYPKNKINSYLQITRISQSNPKIGFRGAPIE